MHIRLIHYGGYALTALLLWAATCGRPREESPLVARVGNRTISAQQFAMRCELAMRPQLPGSIEEQKKALLEVLIDEKLLALEAEEHGLQQDERLQEAVALCADFAAARVLYAHEVQERVALTPEEIARAAQRMSETRTVQFFLTKNQAEAEEARLTLLATGSFAQLPQARGMIAVDSTRFRFTTRWGDIESGLDDAIFDLRLGEISPVVKTSRGYVVCRVDSIGFAPRLTETGEGDLRHKAAKILRARKEAARADAYVKELMRDKQVEANERAFELLAQAVLRHVQLASSTLPPFTERQVLLSDELITPAAQELAGAADMVLLRFKGGEWTIGEVLQRWRVLRPPIATSSAHACRSSMARVLSTMVRDHFLAQEARRKGLYKSQQVKEEVTVWRDHFLAELMAAHLRSHGASQSSLRRHVSQLRRRFPIAYDLEPLRSVTLTRVPLMAVRPGQYGTLAVPPWPSLDDDSQ